MEAGWPRSMSKKPSRQLAVSQAQLERKPESHLAQWEPCHMHVLLTVAAAVRTLQRGDSDPYTLEKRGYQAGVIGKTGVAQRLLAHLPYCKYWRLRLPQWTFDPMLEAFFRLVNDAAHGGDQSPFAVSAALNAVVRQHRAECRSARFLKASFAHADTGKLRYRETLGHLTKASSSSQQPQVLCWFLEAKADTGRDFLHHRTNLISRRNTWIGVLRQTYGTLVLGGAWKLEIGQPEKIYQVMLLNDTTGSEALSFIAEAEATALAHGLMLVQPQLGPEAGQTFFQSGWGIAHERIEDRLERVCCFMVSTDQLVAVRRKPGIPTYGLDKWTPGPV